MKSKAGYIKMPLFKLYDKVVAIQTVWSRHKNRCIDQWNRIGNPQMNPHFVASYSSIMQERIYNGKKKVSSTNCVGQSGL